MFCQLAYVRQELLSVKEIEGLLGQDSDIHGQIRNIGYINTKQ